MPHYMKLGSLPAKRHIEHRREGGYRGEGIYYEEVVTTAGFGRAHSICYHLRPPTLVKKVEPAGEAFLDVVEQAALRHHHLKTGQIKAEGEPITGRVPMLANEDIVMHRCRPVQPQAELFRNASADEIIFVHHGHGTLHTMLGLLPFRELDYIVIPRCTTYRLQLAQGSAADLLVIEAAGGVNIPPHYLNSDGQIRLGSPYSERDLHGPRDLHTVDEERETTVLIKDGPRLTRYTLANHPFDV